MILPHRKTILPCGKMVLPHGKIILPHRFLPKTCRKTPKRHGFQSRIPFIVKDATLKSKWAKGLTPGLAAESPNATAEGRGRNSARLQRELITVARQCTKVGRAGLPPGRNFPYGIEPLAVSHLPK
jgi:hypothetical protein